MAKATRRAAVTETVVVEEGGLTLDLTNEEAKVLRFVLAHIGGNGTGPRGRIDNIASAMSAAGFRYYHRAYSTHGQVIFEHAEEA